MSNIDPIKITSKTKTANNLNLIGLNINERSKISINSDSGSNY